MAKKKYINPKASSNVYRARQIDVQKMGAKELRAYVQNEGKRLNQQLAALQKRGYTDRSFAYSKLTETPRYAEFLGLCRKDLFCSQFTAIIIKARERKERRE